MYFKYRRSKQKKKTCLTSAQSVPAIRADQLCFQVLSSALLAKLKTKIHITAPTYTVPVAINILPDKSGFIKGGGNGDFDFLAISTVLLIRIYPLQPFRSI